MKCEYCDGKGEDPNPGDPEYFDPKEIDGSYVMPPPCRKCFGSGEADDSMFLDRF